MKKYLERIGGANFDELKQILTEAENDKKITAAQYYHIAQKVQVRATMILFER